MPAPKNLKKMNFRLTILRTMTDLNLPSFAEIDLGLSWLNLQNFLNLLAQPKFRAKVGTTNNLMRNSLTLQLIRLTKMIRLRLTHFRYQTRYPTSWMMMRYF